MENKNEIIQLKGPHLKTCACGCKQQFYGRSNQKYINSSHKSKANNEKRSKELARFTPLFDDVRKSHKALVKGLKEVDEKGWVYIGNLTKLGFNPDCLTQQGKNKEKTEYKYILDIAFRVSEDEKYISIIKFILGITTLL